MKPLVRSLVLLFFLLPTLAWADLPLGEAMLRWKPSREPQRARLMRLGETFTDACDRSPSPVPDPWRCPALLAAVSYRESAWYSWATGKLGEVGLFQIMPRIGRTYGYSRRELRDPWNNTDAGIRHLVKAAEVCSRYKNRRTYLQRTLSAYGGAGCVRTWAARRAIRWMNQIHAIMLDGHPPQWD